MATRAGDPGAMAQGELLCDHVLWPKSLETLEVLGSSQNWSLFLGYQPPQFVIIPSDLYAWKKYSWQSIGCVFTKLLDTWYGPRCRQILYLGAWPLGLRIYQISLWLLFGKHAHMPGVPRRSWCGNPCDESLWASISHFIDGYWTWFTGIHHYQIINYFFRVHGSCLQCL